MILKDMNYTGPVKIPSVSLPSLEQTTDAAENLQAEREQKKKRPGEVRAPDATGSGLPIKESGTVVHACHFGG